MLFNTLQYGAFFLIVFSIHWILPQSWRRPFLLIASYYFYASAIPKYIVLILGLTVFNYVMGRWMGGTPQRRRKPLLILTIVGNLGSLAYFKYTHFILSSIQPLLNNVPSLGNLFSDASFQNIILPLGISFFTFEFIHYIAEIYKGRDPIKNPVDFALFAAFFPTQIAGPIKRFPDFMKQIAHPIPFKEVNVDSGLTLILTGLLKKVLIADTLSPVVGALFGNANQLGPLTTVFAILAFTTQIYCDFSGYTDIGRGSALLLGYNVPINFNSPYQSAKVGEFWERWHISLSSWLRDYLFIPLGGSRVAPYRVYINLMITMALGGLWHGTSWHFMVWGVYQGAILCVNRLWDRTVGKIKGYERVIAFPLINFLRRPLTFFWVCLGWVFFRADTLSGAIQMFSNLLNFSKDAWAGMSLAALTTPQEFSTPVLALAGASILVVAGWFWSVLRAPVIHITAALRGSINPAWTANVTAFFVRPSFYIVGLTILLVWPPHVAVKFIYFQF
jgi:alginate O-acetyltransferase complex protein AlgI